MPLITLDAPPQPRWRCWYFLPASLALHALFWGLGGMDFWEEPEMRFFSPVPSVIVSLVDVRASQESAKGAGGIEPRTDAVPTKALEKTNAAVPRSRKEVRKKRVTSPKQSSQKEFFERKGPPAEDTVVPGEHSATVEHGAAVEKTIGESDAPSFARFLAPEYPHQARVRNMEGRVLLRVLVSEEGQAKDIEVLESSHPLFTKAARKSAQRSRYVPLMHHGVAMEAWVRIPFQFRLR